MQCNFFNLIALGKQRLLYKKINQFPLFTNSHLAEYIVFIPQTQSVQFYRSSRLEKLRNAQPIVVVDFYFVFKKIQDGDSFLFYQLSL